MARAHSVGRFRLQPLLPITGHRSPKFPSAKSMAWEEAWDAALPMAPTWVLGSVAVWLSAMPMLLQWGWLLACGRCRSSSGRRRRCTSSYRGKDIDPAPTIDIIWWACVAALSRSNVDSRVIQGIAAAVSWCRRLGIADHSNATAPAICGVAMDVPLKFAYELSLALVDERVPVPGAQMSGLIRLLPSAVTGPRLLNASNGISASDQCADRVGRFVNSRRICHGGTIRPGILRCGHHHDASSGLSFNSSLQCVKRTTF